MLSLQHPVAKILLARRETASQPDSRRDGRRIALAIEGGGMRGVVSAGMVAALEQLGLTDSFDGVFGSSAGAIAGAYFVANQARYGTTIFYEDINNRKFINPLRVLSGGPILSLEYLLDVVCKQVKRLHVADVLNARIPFTVIASSLIHNRSVALSNFNTLDDLIEALRGGARIPFFAGPPVRYKENLLVDASIYEPIPFRSAEVAGYSDLVILLTRPTGVLRTKPGLIDRVLVAPYLSRFSSSAAQDYLHRDASYERDMKYINSKRESNFLVAQVEAVQRPIGTFALSRLELLEGAKAGFRAVYCSLGLPVPQLAEIITPLDSLSLANLKPRREKEQA
jgi:predicted patatin/cPLA2 family phospholipase